MRLTPTFFAALKFSPKCVENVAVQKQVETYLPACKVHRSAQLKYKCIVMHCAPSVHSQERIESGNPEKVIIIGIWIILQGHLQA